MSPFLALNRLPAQGMGDMNMGQKALPVSLDDLLKLAKVDFAISGIRDSIQGALAKPSNKKDEPQQELRTKMVTEVAGAITQLGLTQPTYDHLTFEVSTDTSVRRVYDSIYVAVSGKPLDSQMQAANVAKAAAAAAAAARAATGPVKVPDDAVGMHVGHLLNSFTDTPRSMGLLPTAEAEATTAATHAGLAAAAPTDLDMMKMHADHVINALDPSLMATGPGLGYGVKKAALTAATHADLAAQAPGASAQVKMEAMKVAADARTVAKHADDGIDLARQIEAATTAPAAAALTTKLVAVTATLIPGTAGDGGLQQAMDNTNAMNLDEFQAMLAAKGMPPVVKLINTTAGPTLVDVAKGMTLYTYASDVTPGKSACNGACLTNWPPLMADADAKPVGDWTIVTRDDGGKMWAYKDKPLYFFASDAKPGDATGGTRPGWFVAGP
ncbi:MAG TPA: hypothetical protein VMH39_03945 [Gemmatimonadaceae bacterium]|nr:hypothetical protein [Gemmatimonadaceae bacterium]